MLLKKAKKPEVLKRTCTYQYDETCIGTGPAEDFKGKCNMCMNCRKLWNRNYYNQKKNQKKTIEISN